MSLKYKEDIRRCLKNGLLKEYRLSSENSDVDIPVFIVPNFIFLLRHLAIRNENRDVTEAMIVQDLFNKAANRMTSLMMKEITNETKSTSKYVVFCPFPDVICFCCPINPYEDMNKEELFYSRRASFVIVGPMESVEEAEKEGQNVWNALGLDK